MALAEAENPFIFPLYTFFFHVPVIHTHSGLDGDYASYDNGHYITVARTVGGSYLGAGLGAAQAHILKKKKKKKLISIVSFTSYPGAGLGATQARILKSGDLYSDKSYLYGD